MLCMVSTPPPPTPKHTHLTDPTEPFFLPLCLQRDVVKTDQSWRKELQTSEDACRTWIFMLHLGCLRTVTDGPTLNL